MILVSYRLGAVAVSPQVGGNDRKLLCQPRCHQVPHRVGLRIAVEEQDRGSMTPVDQLYLGARGLYSLLFKALEQSRPFRRFVCRTVVPYSQGAKRPSAEEGAEVLVQLAGDCLGLVGSFGEVHGHNVVSAEGDHFAPLAVLDGLGGPQAVAGGEDTVVGRWCA